MLAEKEPKDSETKRKKNTSIIIEQEGPDDFAKQKICNNNIDDITTTVALVNPVRAPEPIKEKTNQFSSTINKKLDNIEMMKKKKVPISTTQIASFLNEKKKTKRLCEEVKQKELESEEREKINLMSKINQRFINNFTFSVDTFPKIILNERFCDPDYGIKQSKKKGEEFYEFNERIIPLGNTKKKSPMNDNFIQKASVNLVDRSSFDSTGVYKVTKPLITAIRGKIAKNMKRKRKAGFRLVYSLNNPNLVKLVDENKKVEFCITNEPMM